MSHSPALALFLTACLASCGCSDEAARPRPPRPSPSHRAVGVQIWNGTPNALACRVVAESDAGDVVVLAESLAVPVGRSAVDPSLGDDPGRARAVENWLPAGRWTVVVTAAGRTVRSEVQWPASPWTIVRVGRDRTDVEARADAIRLE